MASLKLVRYTSYEIGRILVQQLPVANLHPNNDLLCKEAVHFSRPDYTITCLFITPDHWM